MNTKEFLTKRISELEKELTGLKAALSAYENIDLAPNLVENLKTPLETQVLNNKTKVYNGTWIENILTVIKNKNRFLHNIEIASELYSTYPDKDKDSVKRRVSAVLSNALSKGDIDSLTNYRFTKSIKDTVWGKKEWINEEGKIKKEYMYKSKANKNNNKTFDF
ncbi:hypothetical protein KLA_02812 [Cellulophaga geojensis KL-A]|uniref:Uncharacterized protein n=1 Tax=Cellulophaga geojensis KL-A TaxID=1328323 RepID=A0ABN0RS13_9FLAO|nr:hypothetical protein [Cellulophaga geojensis]EWH14724.1 hypothetical protein KLA_02812 [Cellulophaga geojensis KL-A]